MTASSRRRWNGWYAVGLCMIAYTLSFVDRQMLALLIGPIRADLHISDTQFGLLVGLAFSIFYATMGMPIAVLADRISRPLIIACGILLWSAATIICGTAGSFIQLFLSRIGVGAGEAALSPAAYSLFTDLFPSEKLGRALAAYSLGSFLGSGIAFLIGGAIFATFSGLASWQFAGWQPKPWQMAFLIAGAPGIFLAPLVLLTVREPFPAGRPIRSRAAAPPFGAALRFVGRNHRVFVPHIVGYSMATMSLSTVFAWSPAYLGRTFGLLPQEVGYLLGVIAIGAGGGGVMTSGWLMDWLTRRGYADASFRTGIVGTAGLVPPSILLAFSRDLPTTEILLGVVMFFASFPMPPATAALQLASPKRMRSQVSAIFLFCNSLGGTALGSVIVGALSDHVLGGGQTIGLSMIIVVAGAGLLGCLTLAAGMAPFRRLMTVAPDGVGELELAAV